MSGQTRREKMFSMKIKGNENERAVLQEIGTRIKQQRISQDITQAALADKCGISHATVVRIENGEDSKFSNYIKILQAMKLAENMDVLVPEPQPDFKALFEDKTVKKRATTQLFFLRFTTVIGSPL